MPSLGSVHPRISGGRTDERLATRRLLTRRVTSDPAIYAIGEIAEHRGDLHGITAAAEEQAEVVARHLAGDALAMYGDTIKMNVLKFGDLHLCSMGLPSVPAGADGYEEVLFVDRAQSYYKKCIVKDDRPVGAILMGDKGELASFRELIAGSLELWDASSAPAIRSAGETFATRSGPGAAPSRRSALRPAQDSAVERASPRSGGSWKRS